jgi:hypothetical protein
VEIRAVEHPQQTAVEFSESAVEHPQQTPVEIRAVETPVEIRAVEHPQQTAVAFLAKSPGPSRPVPALRVTSHKSFQIDLGGFSAIKEQGGALPLYFQACQGSGKL